MERNRRELSKQLKSPEEVGQDLGINDTSDKM